MRHEFPRPEEENRDKRDTEIMMNAEPAPRRFPEGSVGGEELSFRESLEDLPQAESDDLDLLENARRTLEAEKSEQHRRRRAIVELLKYEPKSLEAFDELMTGIEDGTVDAKKHVKDSEQDYYLANLAAAYVDGISAVRDAYEELQDVMRIRGDDGADLAERDTELSQDT